MSTSSRIDEIELRTTYDAVVLGSAIHSQTWLPEAAAFVRRHADELVVSPLWLFSVSSVGDRGSFFAPAVARLMRRMRKETKEIAGFRHVLRIHDHRNFAGAIEPYHWSGAARVFFKLVGGRYGDHRDWADVNTWADGIADELRDLRPCPESSHRRTFGS